jgi:hypothetical protein
MRTYKNITLITISFKLFSLCLNLATGILLARSLSVSDRGIGGVVFTIVSIFNVWQSMETNEDLFREKSKQNFITVNLYSQIFIFILLILISRILHSEINVFEIFALIFTSYINSRLLATTIMSLGIIAERLLQLLHLAFLFTSIAALQLIGILNLGTWIMISLAIELIFLTVLVSFNFPNKAKIKFTLNFHDLWRKLHLDNFLLICENLSDRMVIFFTSFYYSSQNMGILVVAMSFVLIVGIPFTASYPYPVVNARNLQNQIRHVTIRKALLLSWLVVSYLLVCFLTINRFTESIYGVKYQVITNFSFGLIIAGFGLATSKYLSAILRGLGKGLFGNRLQAIALAGTIFMGMISIQVQTSWISFYILFLAWGILNLASSVLIFIKIRKDS